MCRHLKANRSNGIFGCRPATFFFLLITALCGYTAWASCYSPPSGLVNYWPADGSGNDLVGTNNCTLLNGATFAPGKVGSAFSFDGVNDRIQIGGTPIPIPWTAEFWVYRRASLTNSAVLIGDSATALKLEQFDNNKKVGFTKWGVADYTFNYTAPVSNWVHLVFVGTTANTRLYVNGALQDTITTNIALPRGQMGIDISNRFDKPLRGLLDEVSLYNRALTATEIASNFVGGALSKCITPEITGPPQDQSLFPGSNATFTVTATGLNPLKYQWYRNSLPLTGAATNFYVTPILQASNNGDGYSVVVTNTAGSVTSSVATLTVCSEDFPDNFACRKTIFGSNIFVSISNAGATTEFGETNTHVSFSSTEKSVWLTWTAPATGCATIVGSNCFARSVLTVYTGTALTNLVAVAQNASEFNWNLVRFNAQTGTPFQIVVASASSDEGTVDLRLSMSPPPTNDLFTAATTIPGTFFATTGFFTGATKEPGESVHAFLNGDTNYAQSLWWNWTAPTDLGASNFTVRLTADAVSYAPNIGVYVGNAVSTLAAVVLTNALATNAVNGMTRSVFFTAFAGTTYRVVLGGQHHDPTGNTVSTRFGEFRLALSCPALVMSVTNLQITGYSQSGTDPVTFDAKVRVSHRGSAASRPLRIIVSTQSGVSVIGGDDGYTFDDPNELLTTNFPAMLPGQSSVYHVAGTIPSPSGSPPDPNGIGYGAYVRLQELGVLNEWATLDEMLITFGNWPVLSANPGGVGGGVIRLDPSSVGIGSHFELQQVHILGTNQVSEGATSLYSGKATYYGGIPGTNAFFQFTNSLWNASKFQITNGLFKAGSVTSNTPVAISVNYTNTGGWLKTVATNVTVLNLPQPALAIQRLPANVNLTINGVPNRAHRVETAVTLSPPVIWQTMSNIVLGPSGFLTLTNALGTNQQRYFRAVETE